MRTDPAISGEVPYDGILEVLRDIEARRITGFLRFTERDRRGAKQTGEVELVAGQIALDQDPLPDGSDPVERLLALRRGHYAVHQRLPPLAVSNGDARIKTGSLAVHSAADLMNYCEQCGLTGTLNFEQDPKRVELVYEAGELIAIRIDGEEGEGDFSHVFDWAMGAFIIEVDSAVRRLVVEPDPLEDAELREPTTQFVRPRLDDTGRQFLKVVEVALADIDRKRKAARPAHSSPPRTPAPSIRPRPQSIPSTDRRRRDSTVPVIYLTPDEPATAVRSDRVPQDFRLPPTPREAARFLERSLRSAREMAEPQNDASFRNAQFPVDRAREAPVGERGAPAAANAPEPAAPTADVGGARPALKTHRVRPSPQFSVAAPVIVLLAVALVLCAVWIRWPHLAPSGVRAYLTPAATELQNSR